MEKIQKCFNFLPYIVIFSLGALLVSPLLTPGFFPMHDDTQVARVYEMAKALSDGMFPVRWVADLGYGYGYPIFNFYAPLAYYVGAFFQLIGFDALVATKIMIAIPIFTLGLGMYLLGKTFWGRSGGLISSILAMSAPYVALLIFVRGAISEYYALSFVPLVFLGMVGIFLTGKYRYSFLAATSIAGVVLSHNLTALIISPFVLILAFILIFAKEKEKRKDVFLGLLLASVGILLSSFYWLPALAEMNYTNVSSQVGGGADFHDHFVCPVQLWESGWGFGGSTEGCLDGLSFRVGKAHLLLVLLVLPLAILVKKKRVVSAIAFGLFVFTVSIFMTFSQSSLLWYLFGFLAYIQYPWRFLGMVSLSVSFLVGALVLYAAIFKLNKKNAILFRSLLVLSILACIVLAYIKLFQPQYISPKTEDDYINPDKLKFETSKLSDEYMPIGFLKPESKEEVQSGTIKSDKQVFIIEESWKTNEKEFIIDIPEDTNVDLNIAYFPAWNVYVNGSKSIIKDENKKVAIFLPEGRHKVMAVYESTSIQKIANLASIVGVCMLFAGIIITSRTKRI